MVRCPACGSLLFRRRVGGLELEGCPSCGGTFFDGGELPSLLRRPDLLREVDRTFVPGLQPALAPERSEACPRCGSPMIRYRPPSLGGGIEVEGCRSCQGIWLDHGEATAVAEHLAPTVPVAPGSAPVPASVAASASPDLAAGDLPVSPAASRIAAVLGNAPLPPPAAAGGCARAAAGLAAAPGSAPADPTSTAGLPVVRGHRITGPVHGDDSFLGGLSRGLRFFGAAFSLAAECPRLLAPLLVGSLLQAAVLAAFVYWIFAVAGGTGAATAVLDGDLAPWLLANPLVLPVAIGVLALAGHLVNQLVLGVTVSMIDAHLKGREPQFGHAVADVAKNFWAIAALATVGALVDLAAGMVRNAGDRRGLASLVLAPLAHGLANLLEAAWTVLGFLLLPVILVEDVGLREALGRVRAIHRGSLLPIAVGEVGLRALGAVAGFAFVAALLVVAVALWPLGAGELRGLLVLGLLVGAVGAAAFAYLRGAYYTCLYLWAAETERVGDPARATVPSLLAEAL